ncbi:MAG: ISNCY family transposase [Dictyoglomi bacterium]|nr:ISNCY family transposase [Dictyoglomota bacterium]
MILGSLHSLFYTLPKHAIPDNVKEKVVLLYNSKYLGANYSHTTELLAENDNIHLGISSVRRILKKAGITSPKEHRPPKIHSSRHRMPREGMIVQMDASLHQWLEDRYPSFSLVSAIDDATGKVLGATLRKREDLEGYFEVLKQVTTNYGIPDAVYTDRHTIFTKYLSIDDEPEEIENSLTQFGKAISELGINHIFALTPQAKGRIERLWQTFQDRLVIELRLAGINTMEEAIDFLPGFIKKYNERFSVVPLDPNPAYRPCPDTRVLDLTLCKRAERKALNGSTFSYLGKTYQLIDESNILPLRHNTKITIHILPDGELLGKYNGKYYKMEEFHKPEPVSKQAERIEAKGPREPYKPGPDQEVYYKIKF